jgi:hypothetical protein
MWSKLKQDWANCTARITLLMVMVEGLEFEREKLEAEMKAAGEAIPDEDEVIAELGIVI